MKTWDGGLKALLLLFLTGLGGCILGGSGDPLTEPDEAGDAGNESLCQPNSVAAELFAVDSDSPQELVSDGSSLYWANAGSQDPLGNQAPGSIMSSSLDGGPAQVVAAGVDRAKNLAVSASHVYWSEGGSVMRAAKLGSANSELVYESAEAHGVEFLAVTEDELVVAGAVDGVEKLQRMDLDGSNRSELASFEPGEEVLGFAHHGDFIYVLVGLGEVFSARRALEISLSGQEPRVLVELSEGTSALTLHADSTSLFIVHDAEDTGVINKLDLETLEMLLVLNEGSNVFTHDVALDSQNLYVGYALGDANSQIVRASKEPALSETLVDRGPRARPMTDLVVVGDFVYFSYANNSDCSGEIWRVPTF